MYFMKKSVYYFIKELKRHYTIEFAFTFLLLILLLLLPIYFVSGNLKFDKVEFANIYASTVFGALLIGIVLQIFELYKSSNAAYSRPFNFICSLDRVTKSLSNKLMEKETNVGAYSSLLSHYKNHLENSFTYDNETNEIILELCNNVDLIYLIDSLKFPNGISSTKKEKLIQSAKNLSFLTEKILLKL